MPDLSRFSELSLRYTHQGYNLMLQNVQLPLAYLPFAYLHQTQVMPSPSIKYI